MKRALFILIFTAAVCGAVFAADEESAGREEMSPGPARKERMALISAQPAGGAPRAIIDIGDEAFPKPEPVKNIEPVATAAVSVEEISEKTATETPVAEAPVAAVQTPALEPEPESPAETRVVLPPSRQQK